MDLDYKVIVLGDPGIGKREFLKSIPNVEFPYEDRTVGVNIAKIQVELNTEKNKTVNLMLWDIAGQPQFYMLHKPYFNGADGIMLVYDITRSSSFSNMNNWWQNCIKYGLAQIPRILVGILQNENSEEERKIISPMAQHLGEKLSAPYFEVALHTGENINLIFQTIAELVYRNKIGVYQYDTHNVKTTKKKKKSKKLQEKPIFAIFAEKLMENIKIFNEIKECPNCKTIIENKEKICPECGTELRFKSFEENMDYIRRYLLDISSTQYEIIQILGTEIKRLYKIIVENNLEDPFGIKKQKDIFFIMSEIPKIASNKSLGSFFFDLIEIYLEKNREEFLKK